MGSAPVPFTGNGPFLAYPHLHTPMQPVQAGQNLNLNNNLNNHNRVNVDRIKQGLDVRTTIMLRNIPNRMDWVSTLCRFMMNALLTSFAALFEATPG